MKNYLINLPDQPDHICVNNSYQNFITEVPSIVNSGAPITTLEGI